MDGVRLSLGLTILIILISLQCSHRPTHAAAFNPFFTGRFSFLTTDAPTQPSTQSAWQRFLNEHNRRHHVHTEKVLHVTLRPTLPIWVARLTITTTKRTPYTLPRRPTTTNVTVKIVKQSPAPKHARLPKVVFSSIKDSSEKTTDRGAQLLRIIEDDVKNRFVMFKEEDINLPRMFATIPPDDPSYDSPDEGKLINEIAIRVKSYWYIALIVGLLGCAVFIMGALWYQRYRAIQEEEQKNDKLALAAETNMVQSNDNLPKKMAESEISVTEIDIVEPPQIDEIVEDADHVFNTGYNDLHIVSGITVNPPISTEFSMIQPSYAEIMLTPVDSMRPEAEPVPIREQQNHLSVSPVNRRDDDSVIFDRHKLHATVPAQSNDSEMTGNNDKKVPVQSENAKRSDTSSIEKRSVHYPLPKMMSVEEQNNEEFQSQPRRPRSLSVAPLRQQSTNPNVLLSIPTDTEQRNF